MTRFFTKRTVILALSAFVLLLFAYMTYQTPLAGDDWGYALNGMSGHPLELVKGFYMTWSGRIFSELWGFLAAPNKWVWNIVNPLCFAGIYLAMNRLTQSRNHWFLCALLLLAGMLSVDDNLRMETYSWLMGETYVIPLALSMLYLCAADGLIREDYPSRTTKVLALLSNLALFVTGLMMENIAAAMLAGTVVLCIYTYCLHRRIFPYFLLNFAVITVAFVILRLSPGAAARAARDSAVWANMSLFEKIASAYPNFLQMTFINNNYAIGLFAVCCSTVLLLKRKRSLAIRLPLLLVQALAVFTVFSFVLFKGENPFTDGGSLYSMIFWPVYTVCTFLTFFASFEEGIFRDKVVFLLGLAGLCGVVMLYSPIYGSRSALYTVYFLLVTAALLLDSVDLPKWTALLLLVLFTVIIGDRTHEYLSKYRLVGETYRERTEILQYYREHPEDKEAWIPRFPVFTVHGGDIEPDDTYHLETFKEYYQLPQDADKIIFYFKDSE
ncbi:MAG: hypothetical protein IKE21_01760 [Erysipelotrichaceae bacterium]|nr:hypothetical protein [Erysipelotrichaceae bacterium]